MLSVERCREILGADNEEVSDKEIESLQNYLELEQLRFNQIFDFTITKSSEIEDDLALPPLLLQPFVENAIIHGLIPKQEKGTIAISFELKNENQ